MLQENSDKRKFPKKQLFTKESDNMFLSGCLKLEQRNVDVSSLWKNKPVAFQKQYKLKQFKADDCKILKINNQYFPITDTTEIIFAVPDSGEILRKVRSSRDVEGKENNIEYYNVKSGTVNVLGQKVGDAGQSQGINVKENSPIRVIIKDNNIVRSNLFLTEANIYLLPLDPDKFYDEEEFLKKSEEEKTQILENANDKIKRVEADRIEFDTNLDINTSIIDVTPAECPPELKSLVEILNTDITKTGSALKKCFAKHFLPISIESTPEMLEKESESAFKSVLKEYGINEEGYDALKDIERDEFDRKVEGKLQSSRVGRFGELDNINKSIVSAQEKGYSPIIINFDQNKSLKERVKVINEYLGNIIGYKIVGNENQKPEDESDTLLPAVDKMARSKLPQCPENLESLALARGKRCKPYVITPKSKPIPSLFNKLYSGIPIDVRILSGIENVKEFNKVNESANKEQSSEIFPIIIQPNENIPSLKYKLVEGYEQFGYVAGHIIEPMTEKQEEKAKAKVEGLEAPKQKFKTTETSDEIRDIFGMPVPMKEQPVQEIIKEELEGKFSPNKPVVPKSPPTEEALFRESIMFTKLKEAPPPNIKKAEEEETIPQKPVIEKSKKKSKQPQKSGFLD